MAILFERGSATSYTFRREATFPSEQTKLLSTALEERSFRLVDDSLGFNDVAKQLQLRATPQGTRLGRTLASPQSEEISDSMKYLKYILLKYDWLEKANSPFLYPTALIQIRWSYLFSAINFYERYFSVISLGKKQWKSISFLRVYGYGGRPTNDAAQKMVWLKTSIRAGTFSKCGAILNVSTHIAFLRPIILGILPFAGRPP